MGQRGRLCGHHLPAAGVKAGPGDTRTAGAVLGPGRGERRRAGRRWAAHQARFSAAGGHPASGTCTVGNQHGAPLREALKLPPRTWEAAAARKRRGATSRSCPAPRLPPAAAEPLLRRQPPPCSPCLRTRSLNKLY